MFKRILAYLNSLLNRVQRRHRSESAPHQPCKVVPLVQTASQQADNIVHFQVLSDSHRDLISLQSGRRLVFGRMDSDFPDMRPDIDLEPYQALKYGVSRLHAVITCVDATGIYIEDLNSTNGTYIDGGRIEPGRIHHYISDGPKYHGRVQVLHDGAELQLGKLVMSTHIAQQRPVSKRVSLFIQSSKYTFWTAGRLTWHALILLAFAYGWLPQHWALTNGTQLSAADVFDMIDALERAIPDLPPYGVFGVTRVFGSLILASPHRFLGGVLGIKGILLPFISKCRINVTETDIIAIR